MDEESTVLTKWLQAYMEEDNKVETDIEGLQSGLTSKLRLNILRKCYKGRSIFHKAIQQNHTTIFKLLLETLSHEEIITLSTIKDNYLPYTPTQYPAEYNGHEIKSNTWRRVIATGRKYLDILAALIFGILNLAAEKGIVIKRVPSRQDTFSDKLQQDITVAFLLVIICRFVINDILGQGIVKQCSDQLHQTLHKHIGFCQTALRFAAYNGRGDVVRMLTGPPTNRQRLEVLENSNRLGREMSIEEGNTGISDILRELRSTAFIGVSSSASGGEAGMLVERQKKLDWLAESEELSSEDIKDLSPHSKHYLIPIKQTSTRQHAFIFYNANDREGAHDEAITLVEAFCNLGFEVRRLEWNNVLEFDDTIIESLKRIADKCSMVVICVMAHGKAGMITGDNGTQLPINDILHQCTQHLPEHIPLLMIIQACQSFSTPDSTSACLQFELGASRTNHPPAIDASKASPPDNEHIVLVRPHTLLVHATVMGGTAVRGALIKAIFDEVQKAGDKIDVPKLMTDSFGKISIHQTPMLQSTLQRSLFFAKS